MTTKVTTSEVQTLTRTWRDLDPKVRNALNVWVLTLAICVTGLLVNTLTWIDAAYLFVPVTIAVITAYCTTSKHKQLILAVAKEGDAIIHAISPEIEKALPHTPIIGAAQSVLDDITTAVAAVPDEELDKTAVISPGAKFFAARQSQPVAVPVSPDGH